MPSRTTRSITLAGPNAATFANAQFGSAVLDLGVGRWQWSGWMDPKGRVRALLQIARLAPDRLVAVPRGGDADVLAADLKRFVFRASVTIAVSDTLAIADGAARADGSAEQDDDGTIVLGEGDASLRIGAVRGDDAWVLRHIEKGFAWLPDNLLDRLLPPALSMERLHAVAFDKGCFPGQEIAARLHFLGGHKKHLHAVRSDAVLCDGDLLANNGKDIGSVLMCHASASHGNTMSLVVLDDACVDGTTVETDATRLHIVSTFEA
jgi:folate-binding protein YgfZ